MPYTRRRWFMVSYRRCGGTFTGFCKVRSLHEAQSWFRTLRKYRGCDLIEVFDIEPWENKWAPSEDSAQATDHIADYTTW